MKKRILSFLLAFVLLFNAFTVLSFALDEETVSTTANGAETLFTPLSVNQIKDKVGANNVIAATSFDNVVEKDFASLWADNRVYYDRDNNKITDADKLDLIKATLMKLGSKTTYNADFAEIGSGLSATDNNQVFDVVKENGNSYISLTNALTSAEYDAIYGTYYKENNTKVYLTRSYNSSKPIAYAGESYTSYTFAALTQDGYNAIVNAGKADASFAVSFDIKPGNMNISKT